MKEARPRAALGWSVHTGWAVVVAVSGAATSATVVDRRRIEMLPHRDVKRPRFVYHAAQKLAPDAAARLVHESIDMSWKNAKAAIQTAARELRGRGYEVVASGIVVGNKRLEAPLAAILKSHALIHTAECQLFRDAIARACPGLRLPITEVAAKELETRAAQALRLPERQLATRLANIGSTAGRPWLKDHRHACLGGDDSAQVNMVGVATRSPAR